jgi:hypothetical protein
MKKIIKIIAVVSALTSSAYAGFLCHWTVSSPCADWSQITYECNPNSESHYTDLKSATFTAGSDINHCSAIGLGAGSEDCITQAEETCYQDAIYELCSGFESTLDNSGLVTPQAAGGATCNP